MRTSAGESGDVGTVAENPGAGVRRPSTEPPNGAGVRQADVGFADERSRGTAGEAAVGEETGEGRSGVVVTEIGSLGEVVGVDDSFAQEETDGVRLETE